MIVGYVSTPAAPDAPAEVKVTYGPCPVLGSIGAVTHVQRNVVGGQIEGFNPTHAAWPPDAECVDPFGPLDIAGGALRPQSDPIPAGRHVAPDLLTKLDLAGHAEAAVLVRERVKVGHARYGQPLMTEDGRDTMRDAVEEMGDLLLYAHSARMQGLDLAPLRALMPALMEVLE